MMQKQGVRVEFWGNEKLEDTYNFRLFSVALLVRSFKGIIYVYYCVISIIFTKILIS